jgi:DtxR family Mn-dependent transcriptional regulator
MATEAVENYLKTILSLSQESPDSEATITKIAAIVGVTPSTATTMVKKLSGAGLARYRRYGGVRLSPKGTRAANDVLRRHRIVEQFLVQVVGLDWSEVHVEAERLEHAISPKLLDRLDHMLGSPEFDPHGDPIPNAKGESTPSRLVPLCQCPKGARVKVARIRKQEAEFLRFVDRSGLRPGSEVVIEQCAPEAGAVAVRPEGGVTISLATAVAEQVLVVPSG